MLTALLLTTALTILAAIVGTPIARRLGERSADRQIHRWRVQAGLRDIAHERWLLGYRRRLQETL